MVIIKTFDSVQLKPLVPPDGSSLEEQMNTFLATLDAKNVLDVLKESGSVGKYGLNTTHFGTIIYRTA